MTEPDYKGLCEILRQQLVEERRFVFGCLDKVKGELVGIRANLVPDDMDCVTYINALMDEAMRIASLGPTPIDYYYNRFGCKIEGKND